jgi:hypothetical protein
MLGLCIFSVFTHLICSMYYVTSYSLVDWVWSYLLTIVSTGWSRKACDRRPRVRSL